MHINNRLFGALILTTLTFASQLGATEIQTTSYQSWLATVSGSASEWNFSIPNNTYDTAAGYNLSVGSFGPVNITGPDGSGYNLTKNPGYGSSNNIALQGPSDGIGSMTFATPSVGLTAFLFGLGITGSAKPITITLSDGETFTANPTVGSSVLEGFSSATPITGFVLTTGSGSQVQLTDFFAGVSNEPATTGAASAPAAEMATAVMIGSGLLFFAARRKLFSNLSKAKAA